MLGTLNLLQDKRFRILEPALFLLGCYIFSYKELFGLVYFTGLVIIYSLQKVTPDSRRTITNPGLIISLSLLLIFETISYLTSINRINSFLFLEFIAFFLLAVFLFTKWKHRDFSIRIVIIVFAASGVYQYWETIYHLIQFIDPDPVSRIQMLIYSRDIYIPQGMNQGWVTTLVGSFPFILLLFPMAKRPFQLTVLCVFLCAGVFSIIMCLGRAGILAMVFMLGLFLLLLLWTRYFPLRLILINGSFGVVILIAALFAFREPVITTFKMNETEIQRSSAVSRTEVFTAAWEHLPEIPIGVGALNFSLYYQTKPEISSDRPDLLHANSILSEWLIEKGWVGSLLYCLLFLYGGIRFVRVFRNTSDKKQLLYAGIAVLGIGGILLRDVFFATVPRDQDAFMKLVILFGITFISASERDLNTDRNYIWVRKWGKLFTVLPVAFIAWILIHGALTYIGRKLNYKAIQLIEEGEYDEASRYLNKALKYIPRDGRVLFHLSYIQSMQAIEEPEVIPEKYDPSIVSSQEKFELALRNMDKCIDLSIGDDSYYHLFAWLQFLGNDLSSAKTSIDSAISIYPNQAEFYLTQGLILNAQGRTFESSGSFKRALFIDPGLCISVFWRRFEHQYDLDKRSLLDEVLSMSDWDTSESVDLARLGALHFFKGDYNTSRDYLNSALEIQPNYSRPYLYLAVMDFCDGDRETAIELLSKSVSLNGRDYAVLITLADLLKDLDSTRAEELTRSATFYYNDLKTAHTDRRRSRYKDRAPWIRNDYMPPSVLYYYAPEFRSLAGDCMNQGSGVRD